jgi:hypothetical protein
MNADAVLPGVGRMWLADFGSDGPWAHFAVGLELTSATRLSLTLPGLEPGRGARQLVSGRGEFVQMLGTLTEVRPRSAP